MERLGETVVTSTCFKALISFVHQLTGAHGVEITEDLIQIVESLTQFHHLSPQNRVLSLNVEIVVGGEVDAVQDLVVFFAELSHLGH